MIIRRFLTGILIFSLTSISFSMETKGSKVRRIEREETPKVPIILPWTPDEVPEPLLQFDNAARNGDEVGLVLNLLEIGYGAHHMNEWDLATKAYDFALDRIDTIDAKSKTTKQARSLFSGEKVKVFKGEPYERSMAFFYRGLIAAQLKDYELARACFRSASFYDSNAAQQYEGDYVIHYWMEAKMDQLLGQTDRAKDVFRWAAESAELASLSPSLIPNPDASANTIMIIEAGGSPIKVGTGKYGSVLSFNPPIVPPPEGGIALNHITDGQIHFPKPTENVLAQARSRGQRMADRINNSKAAFKSFSDALSTGIIATGGALALQSNNNDQAIAGGLLMLGGLIMKGVSQSTNPTADLRYWKSLPTHIYIVPLSVNGISEFKISALDHTDNEYISKYFLIEPGDSQNPNFLLTRLE